MKLDSAAGGGSLDRSELRESSLLALQEKLRDETVAREKAEQALRELKGELKAFSYSLTHDLRAPLRAMHSFGELLVRESGPQLSARGRDCLERILKASERLDRLIQDVLVCCDLQERTIELAPVDVDLLLREVLAERSELQAPAVEIKIQSPLLPMYGHAALLTQCVSHLLDNAVRFVLQGTQPGIHIWSQALGAKVRLWIEDNGVGIPLEWQQLIFEMFHKAHGWETHKGTGIGLAIVQRSVRRMGGTVGLESEPGSGSRFWIELGAGS